jgi:ribosome production factor 2
MELATQSTSKRIRRILEKRDPQVNENPKTALFIKGTHTSEDVRELLKELV